MIGLFTGLYTNGWEISDFDRAILFCKDNGVDYIILKVFEQNTEWYAKLGGPDTVISHINAMGLDVLPYGFFYGNVIDEEIKVANYYLEKYGKFCADMESVPNWYAEKFGLAFKDHKGILSCSTWANPVTHNWLQNIEQLNDVIDIWMPQVYSDELLKDLYSQFPKVFGKIQPTFSITNTSFESSGSYSDFSLWHYGAITGTSSSFYEYINLNKGVKMDKFPTNSKGMIINLLPTTQFQPGKSEFECGAFAVAVAQRSTHPLIANNDSEDNLIAYAEKLYAMITGNDLSSNTSGVSVDDMHTMIKNTQSYSPPGLHYWDILSINPKSNQSNDVSQIRTALEHGYPVIATIREDSIFDVEMGKSPYWWGPKGNHIIVYVGIKGNNFLVADTANVFPGNLQGITRVNPWPREYDSSKIANQWATIIQTPWLPPIPSDNPVGWPPYKSPQIPDTLVSTVYDVNSNEIIFMNNNKAVYRIKL